MKTFQKVLAAVTLFAALGMFGFNIWIGSNFSGGMALPVCYAPLNVITTVLVLITTVTIFVRK